MKTYVLFYNKNLRTFLQGKTIKEQGFFYRDNYKVIVYRQKWLHPVKQTAVQKTRNAPRSNIVQG